MIGGLQKGSVYIHDLGEGQALLFEVLDEPTVSRETNLSKAMPVGSMKRNLCCMKVCWY
jgi:hypothetical protein